MSVSQSFLSNSPYGYDFVVATTQASINATMKAFLAAGTEPVANICFVADDDGNPVQIDYEQLKANAHGSDPFSVPNSANPNTDQDLKNLYAARFMVGFQAQIGLPPGYQPDQIPDVVTLGSDTSEVIFNLMCSQFTVVQLTPASGYTPAKWMNQSQPPGDAWMFTSKVDLRMFPTDQSAYHNLPADVQAQIANLGANAFSVQQLLFDLDNAALESVPTIQGVTPGTTLYNVLQQYFLGAYFAAMQANGSPLLGCTITMAQSDPSPLELSYLNMEVCPLLDGNGNPYPDPTPDQQQLATLNYLCEANNDTPHPPVPFAWNWVDSAGECDGVLAVNRNTFASFFQQQLMPLVAANCYAPYCHVWLSGIFDQDVNYAWNMTPNQTPTVVAPTSGSTVLQFSYNNYAEDQAGLNGDMGHLTLKPIYSATVEFTGNTIVITQHLVVYLYVQYLATGAGGNAIDKTITDTYTLAVDDQGRLTASLSSAVVDNSDPPSVNGFLNWFTGINDLIADVSQWLSSLVATNFTDMPLSVVQNFIFPGGNTFLFKDVSFSDNQDLASRITYADPSRIHLSDFFNDANRSNCVVTA
ncbi:MAG TPA: hypothetical protein VFF19_07210, partial [Reyranella sp.]|nr:hypothetical protein [Reyranella sp.]